MMNAREIVKITARVFCGGPGGGNPLTVFASTSSLPQIIQQDLAKTCEWESVMVNTERAAATTTTTTTTAAAQSENDGGEMHYFLPSGEEVSFW